MCGIVGYVGHGHEAQQVILDGLRRLEYRGYDSAGVAIFEGGTISIRRAVGKLANLEAALRDRPLAGRDRRRPHALGHPRQALRAQRASAQGRQRSWWCTTASSRTTASCAPSSRRAATTIASDTDTELIAHLIDDAAARGQRSRHGRARGLRARGRLLRVRRALRDRPRAHRGREERRQPDRARPRREAELPRAATSRRSCPTRARCCSSRTASSRCSPRTACRCSTVERAPDRPRAARDPVGSGLGGEGRLRPLHAEGDLRAAARDHRHDRHARARGRGRRRPRRHRPLAGRGVAGIEPHRARGVRHRLARLPGRQVHDRAARGHPVRRRSRQRVPLPRADPRRRACW